MNKIYVMVFVVMLSGCVSVDIGDRGEYDLEDESSSLVEVYGDIA